MRVHVDGETYAGRAVDLTTVDLAPDVVVDAVRETEPAGAIRVDCPQPAPVHEMVGLIRPGMSLDRRGALAAAARSRGHTAPQDDEIESVTAELASLDLPETDTEAERRRLAETGAELERLRERVAHLQGRVQAVRETDGDVDEAEAALAQAVRTLSEAETERVAARQALAAAREDVRAARDVRERRLRLEDRLGNLRRAARVHLADTVRAEVAAAIRDLPEAGADLGAVAPRTVALGIARVAAVRAPLVLVEAPFERTADAAAWLDAPVLEV